MKGGRASELVKSAKARMTDDQKARHDSEYQSLLALYISLLRSLRTDEEQSALYGLAELRTDTAFKYVLDGLDVDYDEALIMLQNLADDNVSQHDKDVRDRLVAAIDNLIDFSVCEEYQLYEESLDLVGDAEIDYDSDLYDELLALCRKYNDQYSAVENSDISYAGKMAALWLTMSAADWLVYWTQNDALVRPSHMALQGYAAPRDEFPSWMIPPIEWNCRCFLEVLEIGTIGRLGNVKAAKKITSKPDNIDDVYSESLAKCGRIFGPTHSYFSVKEADKEMLDGFVSQLKAKYYGK